MSSMFFTCLHNTVLFLEGGYFFNFLFFLVVHSQQVSVDISMNQMISSLFKSVMPTVPWLGQPQSISNYYYHHHYSSICIFTLAVYSLSLEIDWQQSPQNHRTFCQHFHGFLTLSWLGWPQFVFRSPIHKPNIVSAIVQWLATHRNSFLLWVRPIQELLYYDLMRN